MATDLTIACVWVQANVPYGVEYVTRLRAMVARYLSRQHRFVCLTDRPQLLPSDMERLFIQPVPHLPGWWSKLSMFNPCDSPGKRVLYLDLDSIVVSDLTPIVEYPARFALLPHSGTFNGRNGLEVVKRFNSSVMVWDAGAVEFLYERWSPTVACRLWGDQDFIGEQMPHAATMPLAWFPRISEIQERGPSKEAKVVLCKKPKNLEAVKRWAWARQAWGAAA